MDGAGEGKVYLDGKQNSIRSPHVFLSALFFGRVCMCVCLCACARARDESAPGQFDGCRSR